MANILFEKINYIRPDLEGFKTEVDLKVEKFKSAESFDEQREIIDYINTLRNNTLTMGTLGEIRSMLNTQDEFYGEEIKYIGGSWPKYELGVSMMYEALSESAYQQEIISTYGNQLMNIAKVNIRTVSTEVLEDLKIENSLAREYIKIMSDARVEYKEEQRSIAQMKPYCRSNDRNIRREASMKMYGMIKENSSRIDDIMDSLIEVRSRIAKKLGYDSFVDLGYARLNRTDYTLKEIKGFREAISTHLVPFIAKLKKHQADRLGIDKLKYFDEEVSIEDRYEEEPDINALKEKFGVICERLSKDTGDLFRFMNERNLLDLETREGKARKNMSTYFCDFKYPYIYTNLTGHKRDMRTLSHEFGHAFQMYIFNENNNIPEYILPTREACELSSIAMEFLIWSYIEEVFEDDYAYKLNHLEEVVRWIPYRACIDEFQEIIYSDMNITREERKKVWRDLELKYMPLMDYEGNEFLEGGNFWMQQSHVFTMPFYYIDYALAQICALNIWSIDQRDKKRAWDIYMRICKSGGSVSFFELIKRAGIPSPFEENSLVDVMKHVNEWIQK